MNRKFKREIFRTLADEMTTEINRVGNVRNAQLNPQCSAILRTISTPKTPMAVPAWLRRQAT